MPDAGPKIFSASGIMHSNAVWTRGHVQHAANQALPHIHVSVGVQKTRSQPQIIQQAAPKSKVQSSDHYV